MNSQKSMQLIVIIPVIAYTILENLYDPKTAVIGGVIISALEIIAEKILFKHVLKLAYLNFFLILLLGGVSVLQDNEIWFKLFPAITSLCVGSYLLYQIKKGQSVITEFMDIMGTDPKQQKMIPFFEREMAYFSIWYGAIMFAVPFYFSTTVWAFMKVGGSFILFLVHIGVRVLWFKRQGHDPLQ